jgi:hypothetical protein
VAEETVKKVQDRHDVRGDPDAIAPAIRQ